MTAHRYGVSHTGCPTSTKLRGENFRSKHLISTRRDRAGRCGCSCARPSSPVAGAAAGAMVGTAADAAAGAAAPQRDSQLRSAAAARRALTVCAALRAPSGLAWIDGQADGWMDGWMDGSWMDGWMNGQVDEQRGRHHAPRLARYKPDQMPSVSVRDREHAYLAMTSLGSDSLSRYYLSR